MKILIAIGMLIIFISALFMFLTWDTIFSNAFECTDEGTRVTCVYVGLDPLSALSVFIIAFFVMVDIVTVYLIVTNIK